METNSTTRLAPGVYEGSPGGVKSSESSAPRIIRTMKSDMALAVKMQQETLVSIAIAEEKKRAASRAEVEAVASDLVIKNPAPHPFGRVAVVILLMFFILIIISVYFFVIPKVPKIPFPHVSFSFFNTTKKEVVVDKGPLVVAIAHSLIPAQAEKRLDIGLKDLSSIGQEIFAEQALGLTPGAIKNMYFVETKNGTTTPISATRLITFSEVPFPEILSRSLESGFMTALYGEMDGRATPYLVLTVSSKDEGLAGMLEWEATISPFFKNIYGVPQPQDAVSSVKFKDVVVAGKDARMLNGQLSNIIYAFANPNTVIIAESRTALEALLLLAGTAPLK